MLPRPFRFCFRAEPRSRLPIVLLCRMRFSKSSTSLISTISRNAPPRSATIATTTSSPTIRWRRSRSATRPTRISLVRLKAIDTTGFCDQDQLSHDLMVRVLTAAHYRLQPQRIRDADQPAERHPHEPGGPAELHAVHDGEAVRGLRRATEADSARAESDGGSAAAPA